MTAPAPLDVLELRAWARVLLLAEGEIASVADAVDPLPSICRRIRLGCPDRGGCGAADYCPTISREAAL